MKKPSVYGFDSERQPYLLWLDISERENSPPFLRGSDSEPLFSLKLSLLSHKAFTNSAVTRSVTNVTNVTHFRVRICLFYAHIF